MYSEADGNIFFKTNNAERLRINSEGNIIVQKNITATTFNGNGTIPVGGIIMWSGTTTPVGWQLCNGTDLPSSSPLRPNITKTPDLRNRFIVGSGSSYAIGDIGGANSVTLSIAQMPSHNHGFPMDNEKVGGGSATVADIFDSGIPLQENELAKYRNQSTQYTGGNEAHENRPPYYALAFIMRTA
jgi:microcystin-dependent protein